MRKTCSIARLSFFFVLACIDPCSGQIKDAIKLKVSGNAYSDETVVRFLNTSTPGFDSNYDAWKLFSPNQKVPSIYTKLKSGKALSINAAGKLPLDTAIQVFLIIPAAGTYTISTFEIGQFADSVQITITDLASGKNYLINKDTAIAINYTSLSRDTAIAKLQLRFNTRSSHTNPGWLVLINSMPVKCYGESNGKILLNNMGSEPIDYTLKKGDFVKTGTLNPGKDSINSLGKGSYMLTIDNVTNSDTLRIIIEEPEQIVAHFELASDSVYIQAGGKVVTLNKSENSNEYEWSFGDGSSVANQFSPSHSYSSPGCYRISLVAKSKGCSVMAHQQVHILNSVSTSVQENKIRIVQDQGVLGFDLNGLSKMPDAVNITDISGKRVYSSRIENNPAGIHPLPSGLLSDGIYVLSFDTGKQQSLSFKFRTQK